MSDAGKGTADSAPGAPGRAPATAGDEASAGRAAGVDRLPEAWAGSGRWIGLVWALPLAALMIVAFLGVRALAERGIDVVVTFDTGADARVDDTKVIYQGVEAGRVIRIDINPDGHHVDMTLRMNPRSEAGLTTTTKFWLIGARPNLNDIASVKAALAGLTIGVAPGSGGSPSRRFHGLSEPPLIMPGTPGTSYTLTSHDLGTARTGSSIYFRGQDVGRVVAVRFQAPSEFKLDVFVLAPYDRLVHGRSIFYISSPVQVALTDMGASANLEHAGALLNGAIELDSTDAAAAGAAQSAADSEFTLYQNREDAVVGPSGPQVPYAFTFAGPGGELAEGAAVRLLGFRVGTVKSVRLTADRKTGAPSTAVVAVLYPWKLHVQPPAAAASAAAGSAAEVAAWRGPTDAAVSRLLARGHRAQLVQKPPLIGGRIISLDRVAGAGPASLGDGEPRQIPSSDTSGSIDELTAQLDTLLVSVNRIPFADIGRDLRQTTARLGQLVSSPQLASSIARLDATLAQAEQMLAEVRPQVGPLIARLNRVADEAQGAITDARGLLGGDAGAGAAPEASLPAAIGELSDAARSIRSLADYLGRHPEALIRGRGSAPAAPAGKEAP